MQKEQYIFTGDAHTAILSSEGAYTHFLFGEQHIRFRTPESLDRYAAVKQWDNGYLVVSAVYKGIGEEEEYIDQMTDSVCNYLMQLSPYAKEDLHIAILDEYNKLSTQFERLGDHASNISEAASNMHENKAQFSEDAKKEIAVVKQLLDEILENTRIAFEKRDFDSAKNIEPLEDVMDDMVNSLHDNHITRLRVGLCSSQNGIYFLDVLSNLERISDTCSNIGISVVARINPEMASLAHTYVTSLHQGTDAAFNEAYQKAHDRYFSQLEKEVYLDKVLDAETANA